MNLSRLILESWSMTIQLIEKYLLFTKDYFQEKCKTKDFERCLKNLRENLVRLEKSSMICESTYVSALKEDCHPGQELWK